MSNHRTRGAAFSAKYLKCRNCVYRISTLDTHPPSSHPQTAHPNITLAFALCCAIGAYFPHAHIHRDTHARCDKSHSVSSVWVSHAFVCDMCEVHKNCSTSALLVKPSLTTRARWFPLFGGRARITAWPPARGTPRKWAGGRVAVDGVWGLVRKTSGTQQMKCAVHSYTKYSQRSPSILMWPTWFRHFAGIYVIRISSIVLVAGRLQFRQSIEPSHMSTGPTTTTTTTSLRVFIASDVMCGA